MPREKKGDEIRDELLERIWDAVDYWERLPGKETRARLEGLAHSILATIDGAGAPFQRFIVAPDPHPEDLAVNRAEGRDWFPENEQAASVVKADVGGDLHEHFFAIGRTRGR